MLTSHNYFGDDMVFREIADMWFEVNTVDLSPRTIFTKQSQLQMHIYPVFGDMDIRSISANDIAKFIRKQESSGNVITGGPLNHNTIIRLVRIIKCIFDFAIHQHIVVDNPASIIRMRKIPSREYKIFTEEEVNRLILAAPAWWRDMILLAYRTGMRRGEIYGLQWQDISFSKHTLSILRSVTAYYPSKVNISAPKCHSQRTILIDNAVEEMLTQRYNHRSSDTWVFGEKENPPNPVYHSSHFKKLTSSVGIYDKRFHDLRHTHITELVKAGIDIPVIQERVGHKNIQDTMTYVHIDTESQLSVITYLNSK